MPERRVSDVRAEVDSNQHFNGASVRRILERAAAEQYRLDNQLADTYSLDELEEMAAEAGISPEALHMAIESARRYPDAAAIGVAERPRGRLAFLRRRLETWSPAAKVTAFMGAGFALVGLSLAFPVIAQALFLTTIVLLVVLALVGAAPF